MKMDVGRQIGAEITPQMIEAGVAAYAHARPSEASDFNERCIVLTVYCAMSKVQHESSGRGHSHENVGA